MPSPQLVLASASPRRQELLKQIGVSFKAVPASIDELAMAEESPERYSLRLAVEKAQSVREKYDERLPILGADTIVVIGGEILGKPRDEQEAMGMLQRLSGRCHRVLSAICLLDGEQCYTALSESRVFFRHLSNEEQLAYWHSGEPVDKAGAYAIQGLGAIFVKRLEGSYSGVMGLPLYETANLLEKAGIHIL